MHIPDGFLSINVWTSGWLITVGAVGYSLRKMKQILKERMVPLMGVMSAFIFAAQMVNFPVMGGTSGHLCGGVLAAVLLGPYGGILVMTVVLVIQCLIFQDGGLTALGANIFNMGIIGAGGGYFIYNFIRHFIKGNKGIVISSGIAAWIAVVITSVICALELVFSGLSPVKVVLPAMGFVHMLIGIGEAIITCLIVSFILKVRPDLMYENEC